MKALRFSCALLLSLVVAGCATMSPEECRFANWSDVGQRDGRAGQTLALFNERISDCTEAGVRVDGSAYLRGRDAGLQSYCRLDNAVAVGLAGGSYEGVCPASIDREFRRRFAIAHDVYAAHSEVARIDGRMQSLEQRLRRIDHDEDKRLRDANKESDRRTIHRDADDERRQVRAQLRDLDYARQRAYDFARQAEWALGTLR